MKKIVAFQTQKLKKIKGGKKTTGGGKTGLAQFDPRGKIGLAQFDHRG